MKRNKFSLSHYKLLSCPAGYLIPIANMEVLPGDSFQHATSALIRMAPMLAPVMHPLHAKIHHFFVPTRLIWDEWEPFITGRSTPTPPTVNLLAGAQVGGIADYLGTPVIEGGGGVDLTCSALPFRAYNLIWNEYYRDQDLQNPLVISKASGLDSTTTVGLARACWDKDYFTTARPWPQKGSEITIPGIVTGIGKENTSYSNTPVNVYETGQDATVSYAGSRRIGKEDVDDNYDFYIEQDPNNPNFPNIRAEIPVDDLREALALQRYEEARARYGSRYTEYLRYLGVRSSDARLQRPEYLGGGKETIQFSEVLQTAPAEVDENETPVGNLKGHGIGAVRSNRYRRFFEEHGYVISVLIIQPKPIYTQGLQRMWSRATKEDYWQKELQFIGQQPIYNRELYWKAADANEVFGYQDRYDEYRRIPSTVAGKFHTDLDYWHMGRLFSDTPALNGTFVSCDPTDRIFADQSNNAHHFYVMAHHSIQARRLVTSNATPRTF